MGPVYRLEHLGMRIRLLLKLDGLHSLRSEPQGPKARGKWGPAKTLTAWMIPWRGPQGEHQHMPLYSIGLFVRQDIYVYSSMGGYLH